jgi:hypothetical protein
MESALQVNRKSIINKAGGMLACDWVTGINSFAWEVVNCEPLQDILSEPEKFYFRTLDQWHKRLLYRDVSAFARNLTQNRKLEVFTI